MNKTQGIVIASAILLFAILYFGLDTKPRKSAEIDKHRAKNAVDTNIQTLLAEAREQLDESQQAIIIPLMQMLGEATTDTLKTPILKQISSNWYRFGRPDLAGFYAEEVAKIENSPQAWSIAGTTYVLAVQRLEEPKKKNFATERGIAAFENAISLEPEEVNHRINLAVCYVENPPEDNPMKGIMMLLDLDKKHPEKIGVQNTLARFAIKTGQFEKAIIRLEKVLAQDDNNRNAICMIAQAYEGVGNLAKAQEYNSRCSQHS